MQRRFKESCVLADVAKAASFAHVSVADCPAQTVTAASVELISLWGAGSRQRAPTYDKWLAETAETLRGLAA